MFPFAVVWRCASYAPLRCLAGIRFSAPVFLEVLRAPNRTARPIRKKENRKKKNNKETMKTWNWEKGKREQGTRNEAERAWELGGSCGQKQEKGEKRKKLIVSIEKLLRTFQKEKLSFFALWPAA